MDQKVPAHILPVIVFSQFAGTSLWFAGNAVVNDLIIELNLLDMFVGYITTAVQAGFILGTLVFAIFSIADRVSPVKVFLICCVMGSISNALTILGEGFFSVMFARTATGFFLAGIYPVGMKIASDWYEAKLGKAENERGQGRGANQNSICRRDCTYVLLFDLCLSSPRIYYVL